MTDSKANQPPFLGTLHDATSEGFKKLVDAARNAALDGYDLFAIVPLRDGKLGTVYRNRAWKRPGAPIPDDDQEAEFFDEVEHAFSLPDTE
jgi:hypothetical protein